MQGYVGIQRAPECWDLLTQTCVVLSYLDQIWHLITACRCNSKEGETDKCRLGARLLDDKDFGKSQMFRSGF